MPTHETDSSKMFRLLAIAKDYIECQHWIGNIEYAHGHRCDSIEDIFALDLYSCMKGYNEVMEWITNNTVSYTL